MFHHLRTLLWLKVTLMKHTWTGSMSARLSIILRILMYAGALALSLAIATGIFLLLDFSHHQDELKGQMSFLILSLCDGLLALFLFVWFIGLITEMQRADLIDFRKMLYLPVSLKMVFVLNFCDSLFSPALVFFAFPVAGLILGLMTTGHSLALLGIPLAIVYYFMLAAWTYYVRGFLVALMENKRRRRLVIATVTLVFVAVCQVPNLVGRVYVRRRAVRARVAQTQQSKETGSNTDRQSAKTPSQPSKEEVQQAIQHAKSALILGNMVVPLGWLPYGMHSLVTGQVRGAALCMLGSGLLGGLGLALGFRSTWKFYMGIERRKARKRTTLERPAATGKRHATTRFTLPFADDDTSAVALAAFLTYVRHPNVRLMLLMPVIMGIVLFGVYAIGRTEIKPGFTPALVLAGALAWPMLNTAMLAFNVFGIDRGGFRTFILLPTPRHKYLLGKNLALFPIAGGSCLFFVAIAAVFARSSVTAIIIALMQIPQLYLTFCIAGNFFSSLFPYRMHWDAMRSSNKQWTAGLAALCGVVLLPILMIPTAVCLLLDPFLHWAFEYNGLSIGLLASAAFLVITVSVYRTTLVAAGRFLMKREPIILDRLVKGEE